MDAVLEAVQLPRNVQRITLENISEDQTKTYQAALPICPPACPMWMEITSLILVIYSGSNDNDNDSQACAGLRAGMVTRKSQM